jgi:NAD(P) transhydrogenase subunit alpha
MRVSSLPLLWSRSRLGVSLPLCRSYPSLVSLFAQQASEVDVILTTANIPGKPAPKLILASTVRRMRAGSVIIDLAAENGGNCELTKPGETYTDEESGVTICGTTNFPSLMADQSSTLYAMNLKNLLLELGGGTNLHVDRSNDIIGPATVIAGGEIVWAPAGAPAPTAVSTTVATTAMKIPSPQSSPPAPIHGVQHPVTVHSPTREDEQKKQQAASWSGSSASSKSNPTEKDRLLSGGSSSSTYGDSISVDVSDDPPMNQREDWSSWMWLIVQIIVLTGVFVLIGMFTPKAFHMELLVFVLSVVVGYNLVWSVTPALHTPLMSCTNAVSGIIILGLMLQTHGSPHSTSVILALVGIAFAAINIFGGFIGQLMRHRIIPHGRAHAHSIRVRATMGERVTWSDVHFHVV